MPAAWAARGGRAVAPGGLVPQPPILAACRGLPRLGARPPPRPCPPPGSSVLSLDDDILMPCTTVEAAFAAWRAAPQRLLGFYPRLLLPERPGGPPVYQFEEYVFHKVGADGTSSAWEQ